MSAPRRSLPHLAGAILTVLVLTGCMTGERPSFDESPTIVGTMTGDAAIDAVLTDLDAVRDAVFTAEYSGLLAFGGTTTDLRVTQSSPTRRSVTIGDVRYLTDGADTQTCRVSSGTCESGIDAAAVSNTGLTPEFVVGDLAKRLRRDATAKVGTTTARTETFAGQEATCVDVPVDRGTKTYCVLPNGVPASYIGGDVTLTMARYEPTVTVPWFSANG
jgi:hypothetical protein